MGNNFSDVVRSGDIERRKGVVSRRPSWFVSETVNVNISSVPDRKLLSVPYGEWCCSYLPSGGRICDFLRPTLDRRTSQRQVFREEPSRIHITLNLPDLDNTEDTTQDLATLFMHQKTHRHKDLAVFKAGKGSNGG